MYICIYIYVYICISARSARRRWGGASPRALSRPPCPTHRVCVRKKEREGERGRERERENEKDREGDREGKRTAWAWSWTLVFSREGRREREGERERKRERERAREPNEPGYEVLSWQASQVISSSGSGYEPRSSGNSLLQSHGGSDFCRQETKDICISPFDTFRGGNCPSVMKLEPLADTRVFSTFFTSP